MVGLSGGTSFVFRQDKIFEMKDISFWYGQDISVLFSLSSIVMGPSFCISKMNLKDGTELSSLASLGALTCTVPLMISLMVCLVCASLRLKLELVIHMWLLPEDMTR